MAHDPTDLVGQEERAKESAEEARIQRLKDDADFRWLMRQRPFRRFLWNVMGDAGVFRLTFNRDAAVMSFLEGQRSVGLQLLERIERVSPSDFDLMRTEVRDQREMKKV